MRILITNDDGIQAPQLIPLVKWAKKLGDVTVAAPKVEQSGKSHGIELRKAFEAKPVDLVPGVTAYSVDSTPADCIRYMMLGRKEKFDLVISGINRGLNMGQDMMYSGTLAAVYEAVAYGMKAIALSTAPDTYDTAVNQLDMVWDFFCKHDLLSKNQFYNVNLPHEPKGFRITYQGGPYYSDDFICAGEDLIRPQGKCVHVNGGNLDMGCDAVASGYISVTPLVLQRANMELFHSLSANLNV